ncbi:hypothetical protein [Francisella marina]|uniref:Uncharacterized protein n=1 Tax=Francisella marina TaxID=2249302 RepID=A0ABX5ZGI9_9GAMM|nr:hypothetical protein [Francisella marina]QEO57504.1 hypothetical protein F0R74_06430 [Francisella marina]QEO58377.1 hypothetical protein F0R75_00790 [Francisella marina]
MRNRLSPNMNGSALLMALILSFVIMIMLGGLLYTFKMGMLTTKSIIRNSSDKVLGETYLSKAKDDINFTKSSEFEIGKSKFEITVDDDDISSFYPAMTNAELFQSQEYKSYDVIYKAFNQGTKVDLTERIIYNALAANTYQNFDGDYTPINVPMINPDSVTNYQARSYRLKSDGSIENSPKGFIGFVEKQNKQLNIFTDKAKIGVPIPDSMGTDYKVRIGWNLEKGKWTLYLLLYDTDKLFTSNIELEKLLSDDVKGLEKDNKAIGEEIGNWQAVLVGNGKGRSSSGAQFVKDNILGVVWYFDNNDGAPEIMLVRKDSQKKGNRQVLEVYYSEYSTTNKSYILKLAEKINFKGDLDEDNIKLLVPDMSNNLEANMVLIFHPNNQSKTLMGISDFNFNGDHRVGKSLDTYIDGESFGKPVIVSKSDESMYIITYEPNKLHRYEYQKGFGSFVSLDFGSNGLEKEFNFEDNDNLNVVVGLPKKKKNKPKRLGGDKSKNTEDQDDNGIQLVVPKFGYLFVFTPDKVMQLNYDFDVLQEVDLGPQSPQILADFDAVKNTVNKIYIQSEALDFKAQEMKDEIGDEAQPEDKSEVDDKSNKSRSRSKSISERKKEQANRGKKAEDEVEPAAPVYLESKYLYPLGIVKEVKI